MTESLVTSLLVFVLLAAGALLWWRSLYLLTIGMWIAARMHHWDRTWRAVMTIVLLLLGSLSWITATLFWGAAIQQVTAIPLTMAFGWSMRLLALGGLLAGTLVIMLMTLRLVGWIMRPLVMRFNALTQRVKRRTFDATANYVAMRENAMRN